MLHKACKKCGIQKPATPEFFSRRPECRNGIVSTCKACAQARSNAWRRENRERLAPKRRADYAARYGEIQRQKERERQRLKPIQCRAENLRNGAWARSKKNGWHVPTEFRTTKFFTEWLIRQPNCECCGIEFLIPSEREKNTGPRPRSPSLDRFDTSKPYTLENTFLICWRCNNIKRDYSSKDLRLVADWIDSKRPRVLTGWAA